MISLDLTCSHKTLKTDHELILFVWQPWLYNLAEKAGIFIYNKLENTEKLQKTFTCSLWNIISPMSVCTRFFLNRQKCTRLCQPLDYWIKYNADYYIDDITVEVPYAVFDCFIDLTVPGQFVYIGRGTASLKKLVNFFQIIIRMFKM